MSDMPVKQHTTLTAQDMFQRARLTEGRDDTGSLPLGAAGRAYARMTRRDVMEQPGGQARKVNKRHQLLRAVTNQTKVKGFPSMDKAGPVKKAIKESANAGALVNYLIR